jgi:hypothetical protein
MTRRHPPMLREAIAVLSEHGHVADVDLGGGAGHFKIHWVANGRRHLLVISRSPSDRRAQANSRATLRRLIEEGRSS